MARPILIEEFHVTVTMPPGLARRVYDSASRTLNGTRFQTALRRAMRAVFGRHPSLAKVRVVVTR